MPGTVLRAARVLNNTVFMATDKGSTIIIFTVQTGNTSEQQSLPRGQTARKLQSQDLNLGSISSQPPPTRAEVFPM